MTDAVSRFAIGFSSFFRGAGLLARSPRLWPFAVTPFLIGSVLLVWGLVWAFSNLGGLVSGWVMGTEFAPEAIRGILRWVVLILIWPVAFIGLFYMTFLVTKVIAAPFHALLAERALIELKGIEDRPFVVREWLKISVRMFWVSLLKAFLFAVLGAILLLASFIPVVNLFAAFGFLLIVAFDCADYSFEARQMGLRERLRYFRSNLWYFFGFASSLGLVFFIPGFNFFMFPAAVAGGSDLVTSIASERRNR